MAIDRTVPGQLDLFQVDDFHNTLASNFSAGTSSVSTRSKVSVSPSITRETIERVAVKLINPVAKYIVLAYVHPFAA